MTEKMASLKSDVISGAKWSSISQIGRQSIQLVTIIVLARLLSPSDFGLIAMATVVIGFITLFKDMGTSAAVIQRRNLSDELLSSIFWVNAAMGLFTMLLLFVLSPLAAIFYHEPRITPLMRVLSLTFLISGFSIVQQACLQRDLKFNKLARVELFAALSGSIVGIGSAALGCGAWSLVFQTLTVATTTTILLWAYTNWKPKLIFRRSEISSVSNYSLNITGFNIVNFFARNADNLLIGRFLGAQNLGYYNLAYNIMLLPLQNISGAIDRVMFPAYAQIQDDNVKFRYAYLKVVGAISLITFPMMMCLMVLSQEVVLTFFGQQWLAVVPLVIILSTVGIVQSISTMNGNIYRAKGHTSLQFRVGSLFSILITISFAIGLRWGINGVAAAYAITSLFLVYPAFAIPFRLVDLRIWDLGVALWRPFLSGIFMLTIIFGLKFLLPADIPNGLVLCIMIPLCVIVYTISSWIINRNQILGILDTIGVRI